MRAYSVDLRERIIKKWQAGNSKIGIARLLEVSLNTVKRCIKRYEDSGSLAGPERKQRRKRIGPEQQAGLIEQLQAHDDYSLQQHVALWKVQYQIKVSLATMWRAIDEVDWTYKKRRWQPKSAMSQSDKPFVS